VQHGDPLERETRARLTALGFAPAEATALADHFLAAERSGRAGHGLARVSWLEGWPQLPLGQPRQVSAEPGYERWDGEGALGYLVLEAIVAAQVASPPARARLVVAERAFPTGMLGHWTRRLAEAGLVAVCTATSPPRLGHPDGGPKLAGTNPLSIAIPSAAGPPLVADVSMANHTYGEVLAGLVREEELAPFGGEQAYKAFALAVGLQLLVEALTAAEGYGAVLLLARPERDPLPAFRELAAGVRLPGERR